jgi:hypothetical protein
MIAGSFSTDLNLFSFLVGKVTADEFNQELPARNPGCCVVSYYLQYRRQMNS